MRGSAVIVTQGDLENQRIETITNKEVLYTCSYKEGVEALCHDINHPMDQRPQPPRRQHHDSNGQPVVLYGLGEFQLGDQRNPDLPR